MKIGKLEVFISTNYITLKSFLPELTKLTCCNDIDLLYWTFRIHK